MSMRRLVFLTTVLAGFSLLHGCDGGSSVVVEGDFPIVYVDRSVDAVGNPTDGVMFTPGGDLYIRDLASPSAGSRNITASHTQGRGDVSDPEVSYDGTRILFAMRGPDDATWNIWEFDRTNDGLLRVIEDTAEADLGDDVDPAYLPDGRIVFSSNRQQTTRLTMDEPYAYRDEYERERSIVLHVMNADGTDVRQISFNQSHDRNPTVLMSGQIMFARWDHVANRNHFPLFTTDPDGTGIFVQYGAFSPGNSFLHPREMPDGRVLSSLMPLSGTDEGGALVTIDVKNYSDDGQPASVNPVQSSGQLQPTLFATPLGREYAEKGRYTTPYPLWDGTDRALVSFKPNLPEDRAETEPNPLTGADEAVENPPQYGIYMFDFGNQSLRPIVLPAEGHALTDPVAVMPREIPNIIADDNLAGTLATRGLGILNVKSVYDTDFLDIMGTSVLVAGETIPQSAGAPDIARLKDPALTSAAQRPARFVRVTAAVPTPPGISMETIGASDFEMQRIVGHADIEPDGSLRIEVPADTPLGLQVLDAQGRAFQVHTNWLQVRPGETRTCNGCHSPRRGSALNATPIAGNHPNTLLAAVSGESMAETRTRLNPAALTLEADLAYTDVWTDAAAAMRAPDNPSTVSYGGVIGTGLYTAAAEQDLTDGFINYTDHVQPIWDANCIACHTGATPAGNLDLTDSLAGSGRLLSYDELLIGDPIIDPNTGLPQVIVDDDEVRIAREAPLVRVGDSANSSRSSHLIEVIYGEELRAPQTLGATDHSGFLNASERRVANEWVDIGAQFFNDPFEDINADSLDQLSEVRGSVSGLSQATFTASVHPLLMTSCASCHQAFGSVGGVPDLSVENPTFSANRFVLTGNADGDFNVTAAMVNDVCNSAASALVSRPVSVEADVPPHPSVGGNPVLNIGSGGYMTLTGWIDAAAAANGCP
jgi:mono/diheme cytochrome c family protein